MVKKLILSVGVALILSGCALIGAAIDEAAFGGNTRFFQDAGERVDKNISESEDDKKARKRELERASLHAKIDFEECVEQHKEL